ncbi:MAG: polysaccharide biosynthesis/export family protein [Bacteroidota bacterium]
MNFQDHNFSRDSLTTYENFSGIYQLKASDVLSVRIRGLDPATYGFLNMQDDNMMLQVNPGTLFINGYSISEEGNIHLPALGPVKVAGLSLQEVRSLIQSKVDDLVKNATVIVHLVSFKISVIGEVENPSTFYIYNERINLLETLARAGDLKEFADRRQVHLIRELPTGSDVTLIDLTDPAVMASPFFFMKPNDVLYIPPLTIRNKRSNLAALGLFNTIFSGISTTVAVILLVDRERR